MSAVGVRELPGVAVWRRRVVRLLTYLGLAVIAIVMLYPFWSMGIASFRSLEQYQLGHGFSLTSWRQLFHTLPVGHQLLSSTIVTVGAIALILAVSATAARDCIGRARCAGPAWPLPGRSCRARHRSARAAPARRGVRGQSPFAAAVLPRAVN